jgi:hypothetical protein
LASPSPPPSAANSEDNPVAAATPMSEQGKPGSDETGKRESTTNNENSYTKSNISALQRWWENQIDYESDSFEE